MPNAPEASMKSLGMVAVDIDREVLHQMMRALSGWEEYRAVDLPESMKLSMTETANVLIRATAHNNMVLIHVGASMKRK